MKRLCEDIHLCSSILESASDANSHWEADFAPESALRSEMTDDRCLKDQTALAEWLNQRQTDSVFLVADARAYEHSGAREWLAPVLEACQVTLFSDFEPNPKLEDVLAGMQVFLSSRAGVVIAVGGGTAIDISKLIVAFADEDCSPDSFIEETRPFCNPGVPLIAIPTTSGTGSEATQFAVVYRKGVKYSVDHPKLLPTCCVLTADLTLNLPPRVTAQTGLDAFCQAVESLWSVHATEKSSLDASRALRLALKHLPEAVHTPNRAAREGMMWAAHFAGRAIQQTRTTAPHAISYALTSDYGVPHGQAVALTLGALLVHNAGVQEQDTQDHRGPEHVRQSIQQILQLLDCRTPAEGNLRIQRFIQSVGCETRLRMLGITGEPAFRSIISKVNAERLSNNPRQLTDAQLFEILKSLE